MTDPFLYRSTYDPDHYRRRLLSLRSGITSLWPKAGVMSRLRGSDGLSREIFEKIRTALMTVPMLPTDTDPEPVAMLEPDANDLQAAVNRTVDAGFALLSRESLSEDYGELVSCFVPGSNGFMVDVLENQTVDDLLTRVFGVLETIRSVLEP